MNSSNAPPENVQPPFRVLVVDDESDARQCLMGHLSQRYALQVAGAVDGPSAIDQVRAFEPDVMLLDIHMPGLDGWGVIREVRRFDPRVRIIVITGWETVSEEESRIAAEHVAAHMHKPVSFDDVARKMFEVLGTDLKKTEPSVPARRAQGRVQAREAAHAVANIHARIRVKCDSFVSNYEDGLLGYKSDAEVLKVAVQTLKDITAIIDTSRSVVEGIGEL
jgi:CheY-like chemotaxis protein